MGNPLVPISEAMEIADNAFQVVRACAGSGHTSGLAGTCFDPPDSAYADVQIGVARLEMDDLMVLGMVASFEAHLKDFLKGRMTISAGAYSAEIEEWLSGQIESSPLFRIGGIFEPPVSKAMLKDLDQVREYRNWVAHGRMANRRPSHAITPALAFNILTQFMATSGII